MPLLVAGNQRQWFASESVHFHLDGPLKFWRVALESLAKALIQFRIARFPNLVADVNAGPIDIIVAEADFDVLRIPAVALLRRGKPCCCVIQSPRARFFYLVDTTTLFFALWFARVEDNAIAGFQWANEIYHHAVADERFHFAEINTPLFSETRVN